ncbi:MAG: hypothetical protein MZV65_34495 [Chromatiales bacterium]|nr:hypothetical protein [Chromatiales bacterium]
MLVVIALFAVLVWRAFAIAAQRRSASGQFHAARWPQGIGMLARRAGVRSTSASTWALLPTKGLTLPLLSLRRQQHARHAASRSACCCVIERETGRAADRAGVDAHERARS